MSNDFMDVLYSKGVWQWNRWYDDSIRQKFIKDDKKLFLSMNSYLREGEKLFSLSNTNMKCPQSICFSLKSDAMLKILEMPSNIQTNH